MQVALAEQNINHVLVCGSFFIMPEAWGFFDKRYMNEEMNMQEQYILKK
jgi:hypothetical protein